MPAPRKVEFDGKKFPSIAAAAKAFRVSETTMRRWVNAGYTTSKEAKIINDGKPPFYWNNAVYNTINEAARTHGVARDVMARWMGWGLVDIGQVMEMRSRLSGRPVEWNGKTYSSITEAAQALGISAAGMHHRIEKGYTRDEDILDDARSKLNERGYRNCPACGEPKLAYDSPKRYCDDCKPKEANRRWRRKDASRYKRHKKRTVENRRKKRQGD